MKRELRDNLDENTYINQVNMYAQNYTLKCRNEESCLYKKEKNQMRNQCEKFSF